MSKKRWFTASSGSEKIRTKRLKKADNAFIIKITTEQGSLQQQAERKVSLSTL